MSEPRKEEKTDFAEVLRAVGDRRGLSLPPPRHPEPLAFLDYHQELALKREAIAVFWRETGLPGRADLVVAAPVPRGYRTTTKRRVSMSARGPALAFPGYRRRTSGLGPSDLDAPEHLMVYRFIVRYLARPGTRVLAKALNWVIVRGTASRLVLILNVRVFNASLVRAAKQLAEELQAAENLGVRSGFLYLDPTESGYYLEARRPDVTLSFKRLFGPDWLEIEAGEVRLRFPPTVFSQVNSAMLPTMIDTVGRLLGPLQEHTLLDLYCGYGLFSLTAGRDAVEVIGVDSDEPAIEAARANAAHLGRTGRARFLAGRIQGAFLARRVRPARGPEVILLDPPRQGTSSDVAQILALRKPDRIVHIACGTSEIPEEVAAWAKVGYQLQRAVPLDLFPGTMNLETMLLLRRRPTSGRTPDR